MTDWYEKHIEKPLIDLVKYLRNNGINTECSCACNMYIQCQYVVDGNLKYLYNLVYNYLSEHNLPIDFRFDIKFEVIGGILYSSVDIVFTNDAIKMNIKK